jgi:hypothetical protein
MDSLVTPLFGFLSRAPMPYAHTTQCIMRVPHVAVWGQHHHATRFRLQEGVRETQLSCGSATSSSGSARVHVPAWRRPEPQQPTVTTTRAVVLIPRASDANATSAYSPPTILRQIFVRRKNHSRPPWTEFGTSPAPFVLRINSSRPQSACARRIKLSL